MSSGAERVTGEIRALRVARVAHGRVIEERIQHGDVTIGDHPEATLFADGRLHRWFARDGAGFSLDVPAGSRARVALADGVREVEGPIALHLDAHARGKLYLGEVVILFQLVAPLPPIRTELPRSVLAGNGTDWRFVIVAAASFLAHFGFAGAVQADFFDPRVDGDGELVAMITQSKLRPEIALEEKVEPKADVATKSISTAKAAAAEKSTPSGKGPMTKPSPATGGPALGNSLDDLELKLLGALGKQGPAQSSILKPGGTATEKALDELVKTKTGVETSGPPLKDGGMAGGPIAGGKPSFDGGDTKVAPAPVPPKPNELAMPALPPHDAHVAPAVGPAPSDVNSVIARNRWKFRACYTKELGKNPDAQGTVRVRVEVSIEGDVLSVTTTSSDFSPTMNACIEAAFRGMKFGSEEHKSVFAVPIMHQHGK